MPLAYLLRRGVCVPGPGDVGNAADEFGHSEGITRPQVCARFDEQRSAAGTDTADYFFRGLVYCTDVDAVDDGGLDIEGFGNIRQFHSRMTGAAAAAPIIIFHPKDHRQLPQ